MKQVIGSIGVFTMARLERGIFYLLLLLLPTQLGKHFWPDFSVVSGIRIDYLSPTIYVTDILILFLFAAICVKWLTQKVKHKNQIAKIFINKKHLMFGAALIFTAVFNCVFSSRPLLTSYGYLKLFEFAFLGFYVATRTGRIVQVQQIALFFAVGSLFESILAIAQFIHQGSLNGILYYFGERSFTGSTPGIANMSLSGELLLRPYGTFSHPNVLAGYLLISLVLLWQFLFLSHQRILRLCSALCLFMGSIALLLTFSRVTIFLWVLFVLFVAGRLFVKQLKTTKVRIIGGICGILTILILSLLPLTHEVFTRFSQTSLSEESVVKRTELLSASFTMIREHPLFGVGWYNFIPALSPLQKPLPLNLYLQPVHNIVVLFVSETGVVGLVLLVWFGSLTVAKLKAQKPTIKMTVFVLFGIVIVTGLFDHYWLTLQQGQLLLTFVLGLSFATGTETKV